MTLSVSDCTTCRPCPAWFSKHWLQLQPTPHQSPPHSWDDLFDNHLKVAVLPVVCASSSTTLFSLNFPQPGSIDDHCVAYWTRAPPFKGSGNLCRCFQWISQLHPVTSPVSYTKHFPQYSNVLRRSFPSLSAIIITKKINFTSWLKLLRHINFCWRASAFYSWLSRRSSTFTEMDFSRRLVGTASPRLKTHKPTVERGCNEGLFPLLRSAKLYFPLLYILTDTVDAHKGKKQQWNMQEQPILD